MSSNYRPAAQKSDAGAGGRGGGKRPMNPLFMGIVIGLLLGILLALGIALWLNRSSNPFVEKTRPVDALPTIAPRADANKPDASRPAPPASGSAAAKEGGEKPRFEFYQILPGEKDPSAAGKKPADTASNKSSTPPHAADAKRDAAPAKPAATPAAGGKEAYFLQAGAFQNETDAENLKAKIAFAGMEANVKSVNLAAKGTLYRVRLGPYKSLEEVNRIKATLSQNGINAAMVRPE